MSDNVNHPKHYTQCGATLEPIDVIRDCPFDLGNAIKYVCRAGHKNDELEDLLKAKRYITWAKQTFALNREPYDVFIKTKLFFLKKLPPFNGLCSTLTFGVISEIENIIDLRIKALTNARSADQ